MSPPINIDGSEIQEATIDGQNVSEVTIDGQQAVDLNRLIDSFEDGNISEYNGLTSDASVVDESTVSPDATDGSKLLEYVFGNNGSEGNNNPEGIVSTTGLNQYPKLDDVFRANVYVPTGLNQSAGIMFFTSETVNAEHPDGYWIFISPGANVFGIQKNTGGSQVAMTRTSVSIDFNEWYTIEGRPKSDGSRDAKLFDENNNQLASIQQNDTTYTSGGIAWIVNDNSPPSTVFFDFARFV